MSIAGIDYDTNRFAICELSLDDGNREAIVHSVIYRHKDVDAFDATRAASGDMYDALVHFPAVHVWWIEHAFGANRAVDFKLGRVQGALVSALPAIVNEVGPSQWKKGLGLKGTAKKADYVPVVRGMTHDWSFFDIGGGRLFNDELTEHELDAWCIARYGRAENARGVPA